MRKKAFSILELATVLIIIGIIAGGIASGSSLIHAAKISNARSKIATSGVGNIEGIVAWYETSLLKSFNVSQTVEGSELSRWYDISHHSAIDQKNTLSRETTDTGDVIYREDGINELPTIDFASSGKFDLSSFYQGSSVQLTVFLVFQPTTTLFASFTTLIDSHSSGSTSSISVNQNSINLNAGTSATTGTSVNFDVGSNYVASIYFNSGSSKVYVNDAETAIGSSMNPNTNSLTGLTVGTDKSASNAFTGYISELIIFNRPLGKEERKDVMKYLSSKYDITVDNIN